jgi:hypothetical protein
MAVVLRQIILFIKQHFYNKNLPKGLFMYALSHFCIIIALKTKIPAFRAEIFAWGNRGGSNPRPSESQSDALTN